MKLRRVRRLLAQAGQKVNALGQRIGARTDEILKNWAASREDTELIKKLARQLRQALDEGKRERLLERIAAARRRRRKRRIARLKTLARRRYLRDRFRFWVKRRTIYRARLKKLREQEWPAWEPWMANGHDDRITDEAKAYAAVGVVHFGLTVTSLFRSYVISASSSGSLHGPNVKPGRAADLAGARAAMVRFQAWILKHTRKLNEMFGPHNDLNFNDGSQVSQPEGTFNEDLHDSHVHVGVN